VAVMACIDDTGIAVPVLVSGNPCPVGAGGGGGAGDASASNQTPQITQATATNTVLGTRTDAKSTATDATSVTMMQVFKQISASLQSPPSQAVTNAGTFAVQVSSSALPTLAATSTKQSDGTQKTQIVDGSGNVIASTSNNLNVQCANCSGSGVSTADAATFTASTSLFAGTGGFFQTTATSNALTNGQQGMFQVTAQRALFTNLRNASGTEIGTTGAPVQVGAPSGAFASGSFASGSHASGSFASGAFASGSVASGAMVDLGAQADSACGTATGTCSLIALLKYNNTATNGAIPAGTNLIGKVGIDQTTPGTTNLVALTPAQVGAGATGSAVPANAAYQGVNIGGNTTGLIGCNSVAKYDASTTGSTELVALTSSQTIRVCGYTIRTGGTATNVKLVYGTGTNCGTGSTDITPAFQLAANDGQVDRAPYWQGLAGAVSNALCINASGANAVQAIVYYTKF
jgi:hypothetical protein